MATFEHYRHQFSDVVRELAGDPMRAILPEFVDMDSQVGSVVYLDSIGGGDDLSESDLTTKDTRKSYEAKNSPTLSDWNDIHTPHEETVKERTLAKPKLLEWGHTFDEDEDLLEVVDPTNKTVRQGMRKLFKLKDKLIIDAIKAASVSRVTDTSTDEIDPVTVTFPAAQQIDSAADDVVTLTDLTAIRELFEDQYVDDQIFALISPQMKRVIIDNNDKVHNTDFVSRAGYFETGLLPDIYGISFITHPQVENNKIYAFCRESIVWNQFKGMESSLSRVPQYREGVQAYIREKADAKRVDDKKVVHLTMTSA